MITIIIIYAGKVGSGKTLKAVSDSLKYKKQGGKTYSNQPIKGTYALPKNWYDFRYEFGSLLIIDEAQLQYNCRNSTQKEKLEENKKILSYLTMCRHYGLDILFITQSLSRLDVQIRELGTLIYRFHKTIKIPYFSFKDKKIKWLPILQKGRIFEDSVDLEHYLNSTMNPDNFGRKYYCFVNLKALKLYDTRCLDFDYISKDLVEDLEHQLTYWHGYLVM